ncbi:MAG: hypothetical protein NWE99_06585 [Candidatus Bathyarchaeota archaeon]|nr:hypothetical protein [Candidatus Bathyarchaeota archaeon]
MADISTLKLWMAPHERILFPFLAFAIPLAVRAIPEILMGPYIVGFDTLAYYVPVTLEWLRDGVNFWAFMSTPPFLYVLLMAITSAGVPIVLTLKVMSPMLLGVLGLVVYYYANKTLTWSAKKSLLAVLFATLYFVALRASWDMLRVELGLIFLFATLILLKKEGDTFKNGALLSLATLSVVFAHQLIAVIMFAIIIATVLRSYLDKKMDAVRKLIVYSAPAAGLFVFVIYASYLSSSQFSIIGGFPSQESGGFMALFGFASYTDLVVNTLGFLIFCYLPLTPLLILGYRRFKTNLQLKAWIFWIFLSLLLIFISPNAFFNVFPYRWIILLTYPLAFYATAAFGGLKLNSYKGATLLFTSLLIGTLSLGFLGLPNGTTFSYYDAFPTYVPKSMLQNTVPLTDCQDTTNALQWVRDNMPSNAHLLVHDAFYGWASLTLNSSQLIYYGYNNPEITAQKLEEKGSAYSLYLIWWANGSGWYGQSSVSSAFRQVYQSGRMTVFIYAS